MPEASVDAVLMFLSTFEHLPADEIEAGFARFAADAERDPDRAMPVYPATTLVLTRPS
ncbi:hypothetical protein [Kribbella sindirgiensis]|uniref:hypothetical protein n=1 Tax=Kribbella sindirgiensis TaxID=1124744 RepID=UPI0013F4A8BA|nr:hypothetical protein [Kribbella sindirgiensis]